MNPKWGRQALLQALRLFLLLVCVSVVAFALMAASPIDPLQTNIGQTALGSMSPEQMEKLQQYWGVGQPPLQRFFAWAGGLVHGDLGTSLLYRQPVAQVLADKLSSSLWLMAAAWLLSGLLGLALGMAAGLWRGAWPDRLIRGYCLFMASTPTFWLALVLLMIFSVWLGIFPIGLSVPIGVAVEDVTIFQRIQHAILPALTLSITGVANIALHTREKMIAVMESDYVLFARARGESTGHIVRHHALRGVLLPAITLQFASISEIFGGSVLVEQVFSYPGLGQAAVTAGLGGDVPLLLGIAIISAAIVFVGNFLAEILYGVVDPRIRRGEGR